MEKLHFSRLPLLILRSPRPPSHVHELFSSWLGRRRANPPFAPAPAPAQMALFQTSTQAESWILTPTQIESRRRAAHTAALHARPSHPPPLTQSEELLLLHYHESRIRRFIQGINFPKKTAATAIAYFKRFFLDRSVMEYNPSVVAVSSLYAAMKVEEVIMSADDLVLRYDEYINGLKPADNAVQSSDATAQQVPAEVILNIELSFLEELRFHLICYHPYHSMGIVGEHLSSANKLDQRKLHELVSYAEHLISKRGILSDLALQHPPAVIALAATLVSAEERDVGADADMILSPCGADEVVRERVEEAAQVFRDWPKQFDNLDINEIKDLERRRRVLSNPLNDPLSEEYKARQMEKLAEEDEIERERSRAFQERLRQKTEALLGPEPPQKKLKVDA